MIYVCFKLEGTVKGAVCKNVKNIFARNYEDAKSIYNTKGDVCIIPISQIEDEDLDTVTTNSTISIHKMIDIIRRKHTKNTSITSSLILDNQGNLN